MSGRKRRISFVGRQMYTDTPAIWRSLWRMEWTWGCVLLLQTITSGRLLELLASPRRLFNTLVQSWVKGELLMTVIMRLGICYTRRLF
jgi:hypothetical protein